MSTHAPAPPPANSVTTEATAALPGVSTTASLTVPTFSSVSGAIWYFIGLLIYLIPAFGAAKLSYDKYGSYGWAFLAFVFAPMYYVFYAFFVSTPTASAVPMMGGGKSNPIANLFMAAAKVAKVLKK